MKIFMSIFLVILVICMAHCTPYGPRDRDIERHHSRDSSTSIQRVDNDRWNGGGSDWNNNNRQWGQAGGRDRNEGTGRGHTSISGDSPYRY